MNGVASQLKCEFYRGSGAFSYLQLPVRAPAAAAAAILCFVFQRFNDDTRCLKGASFVNYVKLY